jgi:hypothetical protein
MQVLTKILIYLGLKKPDPNDPVNFNIKVMHGINKISILMFVVCLIMLTVKLCS